MKFRLLPPGGKGMIYRARYLALQLVAVAFAVAYLAPPPTFGQSCLDDGTLFATTDLATGDAPLAVALCDVDGDGDLDLVTANDASDTLSVLLNDGYGSFGSLRRWSVTVNLQSTAEPVYVDCCDFDGDGSVDLVSANHTSDDVSILFNVGFVDGVPQYSAPVNHAVGEAPWAVRCVDLDGSFGPDIITANFTSDTISVLGNDGVGGVSVERSYTVAVGNGPHSLALCDFDGDTDLDVVTGNFLGESFSLVRNDGETGLVFVADVALGLKPFDIACCDLDGVDGADVVTANLLADSVTVAYNQTGFAFAGLTTMGVADGAAAIACGDVSVDGHPDVVTANLSSDDISIFQNDGNGNLEPAVSVAIGSVPSSLSFGKLFGAGDADLAVTFADGVMVLPNTCGVLGDIDGDRDSDLWDFAFLQACIGSTAPLAGCTSADLDRSGQVDLGDHTVLLRGLGGPVWTPAIGNPGNLLVTGFIGKNVTEFDRFHGTTLGEIVPEGLGGIELAGGIDIGANGDIFVVNVGLVNNTSVIRYDGTTGALLGTFLSGPVGPGFFTLRFGPNGNLFVANSFTDTVGEYDGTTGAFVRTFVTSGSGGLDAPFGLEFASSGNLFIVSKDTTSVLEYDGTSGTFLGTVVDLAAFGFSVPVGLTFGPDGALYVSTSGDERVALVDVATGVASTFVQSRSGGLDSVGDLRFHPDTGHLLVVSQGTGSVLEFDDTGAFLGVFATVAEGDNPFFMVFRPR